MDALGGGVTSVEGALRTLIDSLEKVSFLIERSLMFSMSKPPRRAMIPLDLSFVKDELVTEADAELARVVTDEPTVKLVKFTLRAT